jgi:hypothetical protein
MNVTINIMPNVLSLPAELLCQIAHDVDGADLINMRLACKSLHDAANRPFAITHIARRRHVITLKSIKALLDIVAHPTFGPYVYSITMIGVFPAPPHFARAQNSQFMSGYLRDSFVNSRLYMHLMRQVFTKILKQQRPVHISVCDTRGQLGFGWDDMINDGEANACYTEALENTLIAAVRANCHVRSVELSMYHYKFDRIQDALEDLFSPTRPPLRLIIDCPRKRTGELHYPYTITYDQEDRSLKLNGCDLYELARAREDSSIKKNSWFPTCPNHQPRSEELHPLSRKKFCGLPRLGRN